MSKVILVGGRNFSGKSTFAKLLVKQIQELGYTSKLYNFAFALKKEIAPLIKEKYEFDSFSEIAAEKSQFRAELIRYGKQKRAETNGMYWVDIIEKEIIEDNMDYPVVGDWRYESEYKLVEDFGGIAAHVTKWEVGRGGARIPIEHNNPEEDIHDPIIKQKAHYFVNWTAPTNNESLHTWCNRNVTDFINHYASFFKK